MRSDSVIMCCCLPEAKHVAIGVFYDKLAVTLTPVVGIGFEFRGASPYLVKCKMRIVYVADGTIGKHG